MARKIKGTIHSKQVVHGKYKRPVNRACSDPVVHENAILREFESRIPLQKDPDGTKPSGIKKLLGYFIWGVFCVCKQNYLALDFRI